MGIKINLTVERSEPQAPKQATKTEPNKEKVVGLEDCRLYS